MPITPLDFLASAKRMLELPDEADSRSAISRGYYCAYHAADPVAKLLPDHHNMMKVRGGTHEKLAKKLAEFPPNMNGYSPDQCRTIRSVGILLNNLKTQRREADYELGLSIGKVTATGSLNLVQRVLDKLEAISDELSGSEAESA